MDFNSFLKEVTNPSNQSFISMTHAFNTSMRERVKGLGFDPNNRNENFDAKVVEILETNAAYKSFRQKLVSPIERLSSQDIEKLNEIFQEAGKDFIKKYYRLRLIKF